MYQPVRQGRARAKRVMENAGYKVGGQLSPKDDREADIKLIKRAFDEHDAQLHDGKKTRLKLKSGGHADGGMAPARMDQKPRGAKGKPHSQVNIVIAGQRPGGAPGAPAPRPIPPPMPPRPPMAGPPPGGPPMGGPPPGGMAGPPPGGGIPPGALGMPPGAAPRPPGIKTGGRAKKDPEIAREAKEEGESYEHEAGEHGKRAAGGMADDGWPSEDEQRMGRTQRPTRAHGGRSRREDGGQVVGPLNDPFTGKLKADATPMDLKENDQGIIANPNWRNGRKDSRDLKRGGKSGGGMGPGGAGANFRGGAGSGEGRLEKAERDGANAVARN